MYEYNKLKSLLECLDDKHRDFFMRLYGYKDPTISNVYDLVDAMDSYDVKNAIKQCISTIDTNPHLKLKMI